jgi:hypothetical protein
MPPKTGLTTESQRAQRREEERKNRKTGRQEEGEPLE